MTDIPTNINPQIARWLCTLCMLACGLLSAAARTPLKVGDKLPEYTFIHLINYPTPTARTSDFRGKLLLLDFWSIGCTSCVASWPKLEQLQRQFAGRVQILLINPWQNETQVRPLIEKRRAAQVVDLTLPTVCEDRALLDWFEVTTVPHIVWVDATGIIRAISEGGELTSANIQSLLEGKVTIQQKNQQIFQSALLPEAPDDKVLWQSTFSSYRRTVTSTMDAFANPDLGYFLRILNFPPRDHYRFAYSRSFNRYGYLRFVPNSQVELATRDSVYVRGGRGLNHDTATFYSYELTSGNPTTVAQLQARMQHDLQGQFPWQARWEKRVRRCVVLSVTDTTRLRYVRGGYRMNVTDADFQVNQATMTDLIQCLEESDPFFLFPYPFVDETNYRGRLGGIDLTVNVKNFDALCKALLPYGLKLQLADRTLDILVISDPPENTGR